MRIIKLLATSLEVNRRNITLGEPISLKADWFQLMIVTRTFDIPSLIPRISIQ
jgi:hypothetical protein